MRRCCQCGLYVEDYIWCNSCAHWVCGLCENIHHTRVHKQHVLSKEFWDASSLK